MSASKPYVPLWKRLSPLMTAHFANDFYANVLPVMLPLIQAKFDLSLTLVGFASTVFTSAASFLQLAFGWMGDRLKGNLVLWGPILTGVFVCIAGLMPNYAGFLLALVVSGAGTAMFHPQATALAGSLAHTRRGMAISLFIAGGSLGFALGPALSAFLFEFSAQRWQRWEIGLWILLGFGLILFVLLKIYLPVFHTKAAKHQETLWSVLKPLSTMCFIVVLRHAVFLSFMTYLIIFLQEQRGYSYAEANIVFFIFLTGGAISAILGGPLSDRFGRKPVILFSLAGAFPFLWLFLQFENWIGLAALPIGAMLLGMNNPVIVAHAQERLPHHASTASAITMGVGWGIGSWVVSLVGVAADQFGMMAALNGVSLLSIGAALLALRLQTNN